MSRAGRTGRRARGQRHKHSRVVEPGRQEPRAAEDFAPQRFGFLSEEDTVPTSCTELCRGMTESAWPGGGRSAKYTVRA